MHLSVVEPGMQDRLQKNKRFFFGFQPPFGFQISELFQRQSRPTLGIGESDAQRLLIAIQPR